MFVSLFIHMCTCTLPHLSLSLSLSLSAWKDHNGYYNCSKYKVNDPKLQDSNRARMLLEKYLFYYQRVNPIPPPPPIN